MPRSYTRDFSHDALALTRPERWVSERSACFLPMPNARVGVERGDDLLDDLKLPGIDHACLVDDHDIGELNVLDEQVDEAARIAFARGLGRVDKRLQP